MKDYKFKDDPIIDNYVEVINNIKELRSTRTDIINRHFYELYNYNIDDLEDRDSRISRLVSRSFTYPNSFLASSLGFNRTTWNKKYEEILNKFDLGKKPKHQTLRSMLMFERLKYLIIKYFEMKK